jgi:hypothetical protein
LTLTTTVIFVLIPITSCGGSGVFVLDLLITHDRFGSNSDLYLNGHLHYPNDIDRSLNEIRKYRSDKIRKYRSDYTNNTPNSTSFIPVVPSTSGRLDSEFVRLLFLQTHRETHRFFTGSGVQFTHSTSGLFHFRHMVFSGHLKGRFGNILPKVGTLRITVNIETNIDGTPVESRSHTHPSVESRLTLYQIC